MADQDCAWCEVRETQEPDSEKWVTVTDAMRQKWWETGDWDYMNGKKTP